MRSQSARKLVSKEAYLVRRLHEAGKQCGACRLEGGSFARRRHRGDRDLEQLVELVEVLEAGGRAAGGTPLRPQCGEPPAHPLRVRRRRP